MSSEVHFGQWLDTEISKRGLTKSELAERCGVTQVAISLVISGERGAGPELCRAIAEALDIPEEKVFRLAGLLSELPAEGVPLSFDDVYEMMRHLSSQERREFLGYVRWRYRQDLNESQEV